MLTTSLIRSLKIGPHTLLPVITYFTNFGVPISRFSVLPAPCFTHRGTLVSTGEWLVTCIRIMLDYVAKSLIAESPVMS